jgi:hypothetical protein
MLIGSKRSNFGHATVEEGKLSQARTLFLKESKKCNPGKINLFSGRYALLRVRHTAIHSPPLAGLLGTPRIDFE